MPRALLSPWDKTGLDALAKGLVGLGWELVASGNTSKYLGEAGIAHLKVEEVTLGPGGFALLAVLLLNTLVSLYYYMRPIYYMYLARDEQARPAPRDRARPCAGRC